MQNPRQPALSCTDRVMRRRFGRLSVATILYSAACTIPHSPDEPSDSDQISSDGTCQLEDPGDWTTAYFVAKNRYTGVGRKYRAHALKGFSRLRVLRTPAQKEQGLRGCLAVPKAMGAVFEYNTLRRVGFTMTGMTVPLDFVWVRSGKIVQLDADIKAGVQSVEPEHSFDRLVELPAGAISGIGLRVGDRVEFRRSADWSAAKHGKTWNAWSASVVNAGAEARQLLSDQQFLLKLENSVPSSRRADVESLRELGTKISPGVGGGAKASFKAEPIFFRSRLYGRGTDAMTNCGPLADGEIRVVNLNFARVHSFSRAALVGTIAHEMVHAAENPSDSEGCFKDTGLGKTTTFTYEVGLAACEHSQNKDGLPPEACDDMPRPKDESNSAHATPNSP